jgi:hypothetical protein
LFFLPAALVAAFIECSGLMLILETIRQLGGQVAV